MGNVNVKKGLLKFYIGRRHRHKNWNIKKKKSRKSEKKHNMLENRTLSFKVKLK